MLCFFENKCQKMIIADYAGILWSGYSPVQKARSPFKLFVTLSWIRNDSKLLEENDSLPSCCVLEYDLLLPFIIQPQTSSKHHHLWKEYGTCKSATTCCISSCPSPATGIPFPQQDSVVSSAWRVCWQSSTHMVPAPLTEGPWDLLSQKCSHTYLVFASSCSLLFASLISLPN